MGLNFFKPTKSKTGSLISLTFNSKNSAAYIQIVKQVGDMRNKPFAGAGANQKTSIQLSLTELGAFLNVIEKKTKFNTVHKSESGSRIINFDPYYIDSEDGKKVLKGYSLSTILGANSFKSSFNLNEARIFQEWIKFVLDHCFSAIYSEDKKRALEYKKNKEENSEVQDEEIQIENEGNID